MSLLPELGCSGKVPNSISHQHQTLKEKEKSPFHYRKVLITPEHFN